MATITIDIDEQLADEMDQLNQVAKEQSVGLSDLFRNLVVEQLHYLDL